MKTKHRELTDEVVDEIAGKSGRHRLSVIRRLAGLPVRGRAGVDIDKAIADSLRRPSGGDERPLATLVFSLESLSKLISTYKKVRDWAPRNDELPGIFERLARSVDLYARLAKEEGEKLEPLALVGVPGGSRGLGE